MKGPRDPGRQETYGSNVRPHRQLAFLSNECHQIEAFSQRSITELGGNESEGGIGLLHSRGIDW